MSIISELNKTKDYLRSSRNAILARGGEISPTAGLKDLPNAIYNIPADSSLAFPSDDTVAYRKIVPVGVEEMARVETLGGMTYKCKNLLNLANAEFSFGGGTTNTSYEVIGREKLKITISPIASTGMWRNVYTTLNVNLSQTSKLYASAIANPYNFTTSIIIFQMFEKATNTRVLNKEIYGSGKQLISVSIDIPTEYRNDNYEVRLLFYGVGGEDATNGGYIEYSDIMVATEELPYEPYFEGLRSAKVTSLKSEGANLIPFPYRINTANGIGLTADANSDGSIRVHGTAKEVGRLNPYFISALPVFFPKGTTFSIPAVEGSGWKKFQWRVALYEKSGGRNLSLISDSTQQTITTSFDCTLMYLDIGYWTTAVGEEVDITFYPMLNYGSTPAPFTPYIGTLDTLAIPEAVQSLEGYSLGVNSEYFNYIDFTRKVFVQRVGQVDLGSLDWLYRESNGRNIFETNYLTTLRPYQSQTEIFPALSADYRSVSLSATWVDHDMAYFSTREGSKGFAIVDNQYTDPETFKNAVTGKILVYALAEPIETDISAYLTSDGFFKVQGGGSIVPVEANDYEYAVASKINYVQKVGI